MDRREYLKRTATGVSTAAIASLAGCGGDNGSSGAGTAGGGGNSSPTAASREETSTAVQGVKETPTEAATEVGATVPDMTTTVAETATQTSSSMSASTQGQQGSTQLSTPKPKRVKTAEKRAKTVTPKADVSQEAGSEYYLELFRTVLTSVGRINIRTLSESNGTVILEYNSVQRTEAGLSREIGRIIGAFAGAIDEGWGAERLVCAVYGGNTEIGTWYAERDWAIQYLNGDLSAEQYGALVISTIQVTSSN